MSRQFKGTPGPWRVSEKCGDMIDIRHENNEPGAMILNIAKVTARQSWVSESESNAKLIAAAPELLEALQGLLLSIKDVCEGDVIEWKTIVEFEDKSVKAINKAIGE